MIKARHDWCAHCHDSDYPFQIDRIWRTSSVSQISLQLKIKLKVRTGQPSDTLVLPSEWPQIYTLLVPMQPRGKEIIAHDKYWGGAKILTSLPVYLVTDICSHLKLNAICMKLVHGLIDSSPAQALVLATVWMTDWSAQIWQHNWQKTDARWRLPLYCTVHVLGGIMNI